MSGYTPSSWNSTTLEEGGSKAGIALACSILALCFVVGTPGNLLVVWTIMKHVKQRSHTVLLVLHLAFADLLVLVTLPIWIYALAQSWVFGLVTCKAMVYIIHTCMYASVFLITIMSVERFLAVRFPFKMLRWKASNIMYWVLGWAWAMALLLGIPAFLARHMDEDADGTQRCNSTKFSSVAMEVLCLCLETLVGFVIPFFILAVCYCQVASQLHQMQSRTKHKSAVLISSVVIAFALCWLPYHILNVISIAHLQEDHYDELPEAVVYVAGALAFISSSVNPLLYAFAARNFQGGLRKLALAKLFQEVTSHSANGREREPQTPDVSDNETVRQQASADV